jgi:hypothetical protein
LAQVTPDTAVGPLPGRRLIGALVVLTAVRLVVAALAGPTDDETYYRLWSLAPGIGYYDHAPMVAWFIAAGRAIAGDGALGIRLSGPIASLVGSLLLWRAVAIVENAATATRAVVIFNATLLIGVGSIVVTPDTPSVFFWGATLWALAELERSRDPVWWPVVGATAGLGLFSKYSVLFLGLGLVVWLLATRDNRRRLVEPRLWIGGAIALALFAPVVLWNAEHQWVSFVKQFGRTVPHGIRPEKTLEFLGVQMLLFGLPAVPLLVAGIARAARAWRAGDATRALPLATSLPFAFYLVFHSVHGGIEGNWPAPLYPAAAWLAATALDRRDGRPIAGWLVTAGRWVAPLGFGLASLVFVHVSLPLVILSPERDPTAQTRGWDAFAAEIDAKAREVGAGWIAVPNYAMVGQFALRLGTGRVREIGEPARWASLPPLDPAPTGEAALWVTRSVRDHTDRLAGRFGRIEPLGVVERRSGGRVVDRYALYRLAEPIGDPLR